MSEPSPEGPLAVAGGRAVGPDRGLSVAAWIVLLLISELPEILLRGAGVEIPALGWPKVALLALFVALCALSRRFRPLLPFAGVMAIFLSALRGAEALGGAAFWRERFAGTEGSFSLSYLDAHLRDVGVALVVLAALFVFVGNRRSFFLARGDLGAPIGPVRWLGIRRREPWRRFVWIFGGAAALAVAVPMLLAIRLEPGDGPKLLRLAPAVLLLASANAFSEEVYFRLTLLATLPRVVGRGQAQAMNVVLFGLAHWLAGSPPGLVGAAMTGFLAYLMGKCVLETRGLLGAWIIHLLPDLVIFATYALLWQGA